MPGNISGRKLLVISDTPMYKEANGYVAFEPVVRELEVLSSLFDEVLWLGCEVKNKKYAMRAPGSNFPIRLVCMPGVLAKYNFFRMFALYPLFAYNLLRFSATATHIHTRGPSHPAFLGSLLSFARKRIYWHKYAGNWKGGNLSVSYKIQRQLLKLNRNKYVKVTVNGSWPGTPRHILSFENPCFSEMELTRAIEVASEKNFTGRLNIIFAGNLTKSKGILELVEAVLDARLSSRFDKLFIAGDGELRDIIARKISAHGGPAKISLLGPLNRNEINKVYERCHVVILPSMSEGFPKVIAEGAAYGCIPVVTDVSSISQYVRDGENGYLLKNNSSEKILVALNCLAENQSLEKMSVESQKIASDFTYEHFINRIKTEVFNFEANS